MVTVELLDVSPFMVKPNNNAIIDKDGRARKNKESRQNHLILNQEVYPDPSSVGLFRFRHR